MNILYITPRLPYPLDTGAKIRTFHLIKNVSKFHSVTLLSFYEKQEELDYIPKLQEYCKEIIPILNRSTHGIHLLGRLALSLIDTLPFCVAKYTSESMRYELERLLKGRKFDVVHFDHLHMGQYLSSIDGLPTVVDGHNVEYRIWQRYWQKEGNPAKKAYIGQQARKLKKFEAKICQNASLYTTVSEMDRSEVLSIASKAKVAVIPNGVDTNYFHPTSYNLSPTASNLQPNSLVFVGSMDWLPNDDAMTYFCQEIFPLIEKEIPDVKLYIVGRNPSSRLSRYQKQNIIITGLVPDVQPYMAKAAVSIAPIRIGGGTRLKILEAMAMKKPVISTSVGAEGIETTPGKDIIIADDPIDFAKGVIHILKNPELGEKLGENGRKLVKEKYEWEIIGKKLSMIYEDLINPMT